MGEKGCGFILLILLIFLPLGELDFSLDYLISNLTSRCPVICLIVTGSLGEKIPKD
jgi:hypothetical protein